jgi:hypothetical protein
MKIEVYTNGSYDDTEMALVIDDVIVAKGDYYHDKISDFIDGFIEGIEFASPEKITVDYKTIKTDDPMFKYLDFYEEDYEEEE